MISTSLFKILPQQNVLCYTGATKHRDLPLHDMSCDRRYDQGQNNYSLSAAHETGCQCSSKRTDVQLCFFREPHPPSTIHHNLHSANFNKPETARGRGRLAALRPIEEDLVVKLLMRHAERGIPFNRGRLREAILVFIQRMTNSPRMTLPFENGNPGQKFIRNFSKRHKDKLRFVRPCGKRVFDSVHVMPKHGRPTSPRLRKLFWSTTWTRNVSGISTLLEKIQMESRTGRFTWQEWARRMQRWARLSTQIASQSCLWLARAVPLLLISFTQRH